MPRLGSCRTISTNGSEVTTRNGRIKAAGVSASRRCKHSLTPSPLRGKKRSLPDHHQQRTGHLQKGTVCKIKYKLLHFIETWGVKYDKAVECLIKDRDALLAFYDFPAEHWKHLRTTNPIESSFATVR